MGVLACGVCCVGLLWGVGMFLERYVGLVLWDMEVGVGLVCGNRWGVVFSNNQPWQLFGEGEKSIREFFTTIHRNTLCVLLLSIYLLYHFLKYFQLFGTQFLTKKEEDDILVIVRKEKAIYEQI